MAIQPTALIILDGFGYSHEHEFNAIAQAHKPTIDFLLQTYPHTLLQASGEFVGIPSGFAGNSEVGHITIGAGRIIKQPLTIIQESLESGEFYQNPLLLKTLKNFQGTLHLIGLLSDAGVHSYIDHLFAFMQVAYMAGIKKIIIHAILDGRDCAPKSADKFLSATEFVSQRYTSVIGSITGRFYAMDRNKNWERTEQIYRMLTTPEPIQFTAWQQALAYYYEHGITDEYIPPTVLSPEAVIKNGDGIIFFNFRSDRARQLTEAFVNPTFSHFKTRHLKLAFFITPVDYGNQSNTLVMFIQHPAENTLKEILAAHHKTMLSIAETEKYAHITYFFSDGKEQAWPDEERILIPSLSTKNYVDQPEMSAQQITDAVIKSLITEPRNFYLINYANADMVGHSGDLLATVKAIECLDRELKRLYDVIVSKMNGTMYITADHGNAEKKWDKNSNQPSTSHTTNPVPFIMVKKGLENLPVVLPVTQLADIAPFILSNMGITPPKIMLQKK